MIFLKRTKLGEPVWTKPKHKPNLIQTEPNSNQNKTEPNRNQTDKLTEVSTPMINQLNRTRTLKKMSIQKSEYK